MRRAARSLIGRLVRAALRSQRGQSLVELSLALPAAILVVTGTIDLGRVFYAYESLKNAAHEGALFGAYNADAITSSSVSNGIASSGNPNNIQWHVIHQDTALGVTTSMITVTCYSGINGSARGSCNSGTASVGDTIEVDVGPYTFHPITPGLSNIVGNNINLSVSMRAQILGFL